MTAIWIWALCFLGAAVASPILGKKRCAEGPTFWCQDISTASECGAVKHCQQTIWRRSTAKNVPCDLCKEVMSVLENFLKDNASEAELLGYLEQGCKLLPSPSLTSKCNELIDDYLPIILNILKDDLKNPEVVCSVLHLCQENLAEKNILSNEIPEVVMSKLSPAFSDNIPLLLYPQQVTEPKKSPPPAAMLFGCSTCEFIMKQIYSLLHEDRTEEVIISVVGKVCTLVPFSVANKCQDFVVEYGRAVVELLAQELEPAVICATIGFCKSTELMAVEKVKLEQPKIGPLCAICKILVQRLAEFLEKNATETEIKAALDKVCNFLPAKESNECKQLINEYGQILLEILLETMDPEFVCNKIGVCLSVKAHLLGADKCVWGPSYWCKNMDTANQCNAVEHCKRHIWN